MIKCQGISTCKKERGEQEAVVSLIFKTGKELPVCQACYMGLATGKLVYLKPLSSTFVMKLGDQLLETSNV